MTHTDMHTYWTNENQVHIPSSASPIRDFTPSGRSDNHPNRQGHMYTTTTLVSQTQTWTHMPKEQMTNVCHGWTLPNQAEGWDESNHFFPHPICLHCGIESLFFHLHHPRNLSYIHMHKVMPQQSYYLSSPASTDWLAVHPGKCTDQCRIHW